MFKNILLLSIVFLYSSSTYAQTVVSASGNDASGTGGTLSYTIGQTDYRQSNGNGFILTEGVQQPYELFVTGAEQVLAATGIRIYPNPAMEEVRAESAGTVFGYRLYDANGKLLQEMMVMSNSHSIDLQHYGAGLYHLETIIPNKTGQTLTLIKNN